MEDENDSCGQSADCAQIFLSHLAPPWFRNLRREDHGGKPSRMAIASTKFEVSQVLLPERALRLSELETKLHAFLGCRLDDPCDSTSQTLRENTLKLVVPIRSK